MDLQEQQNSQVFHDFQPQKQENVGMGSILIVFVVVILLGIGTGFLISKTKSAVSPVASSGGSSGTQIVKGTIYGSNDTSTFKDSATGVMKVGGINGEGQYHLVRPGGDSQNVYMTSSLVDLSQFVDHKVKVWGQTQKAQSAGWLMDVGRVEVLE